VSCGPGNTVITNLVEDYWLMGCVVMLSGSYLANNWKVG